MNVAVDNDTTVSDLVRDALNKFGLQDSQIEDYRYGFLSLAICAKTNLLIDVLDALKYCLIEVLPNVFCHGTNDHGRL